MYLSVRIFKVALSHCRRFFAKLNFSLPNGTLVSNELVMNIQILGTYDCKCIGYMQNIYNPKL